MRHRRKTSKLQRNKSQRKALLFNQCCDLIEHRRIRTTLAKAKALRPMAEKMVTLGKKALLAEEAEKKVHYRRQALATLRHRDKVAILFDEIAPACADRVGGYTRITKLGPRISDAAPMAYIEWVDLDPSEKKEELEAAIAE